MKQLKFWSIALFAMLLITSCEKEEKKVEANFTFNPLSPKVDEVIQFTSTSENASSYQWDFGDGSTSTESNPEHTYTSDGDFMVKLTAFGDDGESSISKTITVSPIQGGIVYHNENITSDEVWRGYNIHIVERDLRIENATLTIEPGAIVKFNAGTALKVGVSSDSFSKLIAQGTADKHIVFTANKPNPDRGFWEAIIFGENASSESVMEYCEVYYAGIYSQNSGNIVIDNSNIAFNNNIVKYSDSYGIYCPDGGHFNSFNNNVVSDNVGSSIFIYSEFAHTLGDNNNIANTKNGIELKYKLEVPGEFLWKNQKAKYTFVSDVHIGSEQGTNLTIEKGVTIALKENTSFLIGTEDNKTGKLTAVGTPSEPIRFISSKVNASSGEWDYILFGQFNDPTSKMEYCEIDAGGGYSSNYGSVTLNNTKATINNCTISNSGSYGLLLEYDASLVSFTGNTILNSAESSIRIDSKWAHTIGLNNNIAHDKFGIEVVGAFNHQNKSFTWLKQTCPYTVVGSLRVGSEQGCTLSIEAGSVIQFTENSDLSIGYDDNLAGTLIAKGTANERIIFKSATPTGTWDYLGFWHGTMPESALEYCDIINSGAYSSSYGAIHCSSINTDNVPVIKNCLIKNSSTHGITVDDANPLLENNTFENNNGEDVHYQ